MMEEDLDYEVDWLKRGAKLGGGWKEAKGEIVAVWGVGGLDVSAGRSVA